MKSHTLLLMVLILGMGFSITAGCLNTSNTQGTPANASEATVSIGEILEHPDLYHEIPVKIHGKVVNECGSGCWFFLNDGTGTIYIDLLPNNFAIPPMVGSTVTVEGIIHKDGTDVFMIGSTVLSEIGIYQ